MAGYGAQGAARIAVSSSAWAEPLYARCAILWEDSFPHAIVSLDILAVPRAMNLSVRQRLLALAGWSNSDITLNASHTHNGPAVVDMLQPYTAYGLSDLTLVRGYSAWLEDKIVEVVQSALNASRTSVTLEYRATTSGVSVNRVGLSTVETAVPVLIARAGNGTPRAVLWSYGCHPIAAGMQEEWDGDFASGACARIENNYGSNCIALFLQGPAGDQNPRNAVSWSNRDAHSVSLGNAVINAVNTGGRALSGPLLTSYQEVSLPLLTISLSTARNQYVSRVLNTEGQPAWYQRHAEVMVSRIDSGVTESSFTNPQQVWKLSGSPMLRMAFLGGELVSAYGSYFRNQFGGSNGILIGGYANEVSGYIPDDSFFNTDLFPDGSYEGGWEPDFPNIAGGNLTVYPHLFHFSTGNSGAATTLINSLTSQLN